MEFKSLFNKLVIAVLVIVVIGGAYLIVSSAGMLNSSPKPTPTFQVSTITPTPTVVAPELSITLLTVPSCDDCFEVIAIPAVLEQNGVKLTQKEYAYNSPEGKVLIEKYGIEKAPTVLFEGDISQVPQLEGLLTNAGEEINGIWVLRDIAPPYMDVATAKIVGRVSIKTIVDNECFSCKYASVPIGSAAVNYSLLGDTFREIGVGVSENDVFDANSSEGKALIEKYNATRLPFMILSKDIEAYPELAAAFKNISDIDPDGNYVLSKLSPPYLDLKTGKEEGKLTFIFIKASGACDPECYDYNVHVQALKRLGMTAETTYYYDYDSTLGKNITKTYNITKIPTVLVSPESKDYPAFMTVYKQIGGFEKDGWFVFRNFQVLEGAWYFDLVTDTTSTLDPNAAAGVAGVLPSIEAG